MGCNGFLNAMMLFFNGIIFVRIFIQFVTETFAYNSTFIHGNICSFLFGFLPFFSCAPSSVVGRCCHLGCWNLGKDGQWLHLRPNSKNRTFASGGDAAAECGLPANSAWVSTAPHWIPWLLWSCQTKQVYALYGKWSTLF